jgi:hypothetical protein
LWVLIVPACSRQAKYKVLCIRYFHKELNPA